MEIVAHTVFLSSHNALGKKELLRKTHVNIFEDDRYAMLVSGRVLNPTPVIDVSQLMSCFTSRYGPMLFAGQGRAGL